MAVQVRSDLNNNPFILDGESFAKDSETLLQDAGRTIVLAKYTLLAKVAASQKWVPFTDETATNGAAIPQGIYLGDDVPSASIVAGDVTIGPVLVGGKLTIDKSKLVIENSKTLATVITVGTTDLRTVEDHLKNVGIFCEDTINIDEYEN